MNLQESSNPLRRWIEIYPLIYNRDRWLYSLIKLNTWHDLYVWILNFEKGFFNLRESRDGRMSYLLDPICYKCEEDIDAQMLLCETCEGGCHFHCEEPKLLNVPSYGCLCFLTSTMNWFLKNPKDLKLYPTI
ncbi:hypothetical protein ROZALSC1DRAFT_26135 [Rozella allomycis CSF55]|uniref:Uncharacterized protein n=1 Tax=Rozella allomycis (strain CSF55) TaxID=988480 RepID=A0A4V1IYT9_ROZAC|nr:hypothetical protein ROZALSC1DRAFT_26135 [Rozella allomycis CSF55]